jgi:16S rRNA (cytidine1402-2'-O)-methyltransferase
MSELILVPTPIADDLPLEPVALKLLQEDCLKDNVLLLVEEHKVLRQRWLKWGLPREAIEKFCLYNEHTSEKMKGEVNKELKAGKKVYSMSDCGLPAFCDPGQNLVDLCHKHRVKVTATPFPNSIALAVALSGFSHSRFNFCGFVPVKEPERGVWMKTELKRPETLVWMETPYRLKKLIEQMSKLDFKREIFIGMDLGSSTEKLLRGSAAALFKEISDGEKREFVLLVGPLV